MIGRGRDLSRERDVLTLVVRSNEAVRLDQYLMQSLAWRSRSRLQKLIRDGTITVNGELSKPSRRVRLADVVALRLSSGVGVPTDYDDRQLDVVYEDRWLVAINKPPGMLVHPVGRHVYDTLINYMHHRYHAPGEDGSEVIPRLCHRIDRDTTGLVVIAKDTYVHREVMFQFENRLVSKEYLTLVEGCYPRREHRIEIPIGEGRSLATSLEHEVLKSSLTSVRVERYLDGYTLLRCVPHTGRQNQIRIHLAAAGYPVVGDERFGDHVPPDGFPQRHLLHAEKPRFYHPRLKCRLELRASLPEDFRVATSPLAAPGPD